MTTDRTPRGWGGRREIPKDSRWPESVPRVGHIRLGVKKKSKGGADYPSDVDWFVILPEEREDGGAPEVIAGLRKIKKKGWWDGDPERPKSIPVVFMDDDPAVIAPAALEAWTGGALRCVCRGDGETCDRLVVPEEVPEDPEPDWDPGWVVESYKKKGKDGKSRMAVRVKSEHKDAERSAFDLVGGIPCAGRSCPVYTGGFCRMVGRVHVMLPYVEGGLGGVYQIATGSFYGLNLLHDDLAFIARGPIGRCSMVMEPDTGRPLIELRRPPVETRGGGVKSIHWPLRVKPLPTLDEMIGWANAPKRIVAPTVDLSREEPEEPEDLIPESRRREARRAAREEVRDNPAAPASAPAEETEESSGLVVLYDAGGWGAVTILFEGLNGQKKLGDVLADDLRGLVKHVGAEKAVAAWRQENDLAKVTTADMTRAKARDLIEHLASVYSPANEPEAEEEAAAEEPEPEAAEEEPEDAPDAPEDPDAGAKPKDALF